MLLGGTGNITRFYGPTKTPTNPWGYNSSTVPDGFEIVFNSTAPNPKTGARRYLLRVINTSYSTEIRFSIDNHYLTVVEADFVPVLPTLNVTSILVAIGQRYHVIVEAKPASAGAANPLQPDGNYWIRTNTSGCSSFDDVRGTIDGFERTGILRYNENSVAEPKSSTWPDIAQLPSCYDLSTKLQTAFNWTVTAPKNGLSGDLGNGGELFNIEFKNFKDTYQYATALVNFQRPNQTDFIPFQTSYGNPTFLNLANEAETWPVGWVVVPENFTDTDFVSPLPLERLLGKSSAGSTHTDGVLPGLSCSARRRSSGRCSTIWPKQSSWLTQRRSIYMVTTLQL